MKKVTYILTSFLAMFLLVTNASAASGSITATSSSKTVVVGSTFTVTVKVSCSDALGSWSFGVSYDSQYISLQSGDTNVASYGDGSAKTKTYTYKFKAIKSGSATVRITSSSMVSWNDESTLFTPSVTNATVTVKTQAEIEASYSKDNNLKSLSIEGYELSPAFSKDVTEYSVQVPDDVTSIKVSAKENDSTASVRGTGTIDISEGSNKIEVVVTAQNGATKTYTIMVEVKDLTPIGVTIDNQKYTVVKKATLLTCPTGYTPATIKINDIDIPVFQSELTKFTVLGLKDEQGNISMFIYDEDTNSYTKYTEIKGSSLTLYPMNAEEKLENFTETKIIINDVEYTAFKHDSVDDLIIIYAMNVEDGNTGYYLYDRDENSFVRYSSELYDILIAKNEEAKLYLIALIGVASVLLLISICLASKNAKLKKLIMKVSSKAYNTEEVEVVKEENQEIEVENQTLESEGPQEEPKKTRKKHKKSRK